MAPNKSMILGFAWGARQRGLDYTRANAREIMLQKINMEETLTEITVYPDTIWWEREWDGEIKKKGERERTAQKRRTLNILQSTFCRHFSAFQSPPSGDRLESRNRHFPPAAGWAKTSACVWSCWEHNSPDPSWLYCQNHWSSVSLQWLIKAAIFPAPSPAGFFCTYPDVDQREDNIHLGARQI